jgi:predicted ferric reductase
MQTISQPGKKRSLSGLARWGGMGVMLILGLIFASFMIQWAGQTQAGKNAGQIITWLLVTDQAQVTWFVTRSAGIVAYLLLWLSTVWGLALPSKILGGFLHGSFTADFHEFISLLSIGFLAVHVVILLFDQYLTFSIIQLLFPFLSTYRPVWVGIGGLSLALVLLVTVTFYMREHIGRKTFRTIHLFSLVAFLGAVLHGLFAGTDTALPAMQLVYLVTFASVVFLTIYWLGEQAMRKARPSPLAAR